MKTNPILVLTSIAATTLLTGCASMDSGGYTDVAGARSALAFTAVTDPKEMMKWSGDKYLMHSIRSVDTYYFTVPDTGFRPGGANVSRVYDTDRMDMDINRGQVTVGTTTPDVDVRYRDAAGSAPGYQTESGGMKVIEYRPGHSR
jgi:hypothetical protein